eukprot:s1483_g12.t1
MAIRVRNQRMWFSGWACAQVASPLEGYRPLPLEVRAAARDLSPAGTPAPTTATPKSSTPATAKASTTAATSPAAPKVAAGAPQPKGAPATSKPGTEEDRQRRLAILKKFNEDRAAPAKEREREATLPVISDTDAAAASTPRSRRSNEAAPAETTNHAVMLIDRHDVNRKVLGDVSHSMTSTCAIDYPTGSLWCAIMAQRWRSTWVVLPLRTGSLMRFIEDNTMLRLPSLPPAVAVTVPASVMTAVRAASEPHRERSPRRPAARTTRPPEVAPTPKRHGADPDVRDRDAGDGPHVDRPVPDEAAQRFRKLPAPRQAITGSGFADAIPRRVTTSSASASTPATTVPDPPSMPPPAKPRASTTTSRRVEMQDDSRSSSDRSGEPVVLVEGPHAHARSPAQDEEHDVSETPTNGGDDGGDDERNRSIAEEGNYGCTKKENYGYTQTGNNQKGIYSFCKKGNFQATKEGNTCLIQEGHNNKAAKGHLRLVQDSPRTPSPGTIVAQSRQRSEAEERREAEIKADFERCPTPENFPAHDPPPGLRVRDELLWWRSLYAYQNAVAQGRRPAPPPRQPIPQPTSGMYERPPIAHEGVTGGFGGTASASAPTPTAPAAEPTVESTSTTTPATASASAPATTPDAEASQRKRVVRKQAEHKMQPPCDLDTKDVKFTYASLVCCCFGLQAPLPGDDPPDRRHTSPERPPPRSPSPTPGATSSGHAGGADDAAGAGGLWVNPSQLAVPRSMELMWSPRVLHRPRAFEDDKLDAALDPPRARGSKIRSKNGSSVLKFLDVNMHHSNSSTSRLSYGLSTTCCCSWCGKPLHEDSEKPDPEYEEELESEEMEEDEETTDGGDLGTIAEEEDQGPENVGEEVVVTADYLDYAPVSSAGLDPVTVDPAASSSSTVAHASTAAGDEADDAAATLPRPTDDPAGDGDDEGPWGV